MITLTVILFVGIISPSFRADNKSCNEEFFSKERETDNDIKSEFLKLRVGMFIHYNMATYQEAQWVEGYPDPSEFNPGVETIDTDAWADAAVSAGMKYGVLTVRHVSGFCLWDSKISATDVIKHITMANGRNANFLLNVGPDRNGNIVESSVRTLKEIGDQWDKRSK